MKNYQTLKQLVNDHTAGYLEYSTARDLWQRSIYYNKLQNTYAKQGDQDQPVYSPQLYDEETKTVTSFSIYPKSNYSRLQWFLLLYMVESCIYSRQQIRNTIINL